MPPVRGAGAYMMLEIVQPPVTYLEIIRAALIPAILYYLSLLFIVHFHAKRLAGQTVRLKADTTADTVRLKADTTADTVRLKADATGTWFEGAIFFASLATLVGLLFLGYTPF